MHPEGECWSAAPCMAEAVDVHVPVGREGGIIRVVSLPERIRARFDHPAPVLFDETECFFEHASLDHRLDDMVVKVGRSWFDG